MISKIKLTNFRKHENTETYFTAGLQVLRGVNEAGKSTQLEAICYALFGTSALRTSLDDTVTWGKPVSSLKVECSVTIDGVEYVFTRSKAGAEIRYGGDGFVSGQREVKAFAEGLLGCSADVASLLILADQNAVRGVLAKGASDSSGLVEKLADLSVIEALIEKVQDQLPSGNTKTLEGEIVALQTLADQPLPPKPVDVKSPALEKDVQEIEGTLQDVSMRKVEADLQAPLARAVLEQAAEVDRRNKATAAREKVLRAVQAPVQTVTLEALERARMLHASDKAVQALRADRAKVFPTCQVKWEGTEQTLDAEIEKTSEAVKNLSAKYERLRQEAQTLKLALQSAQLLRINEDTCAFCKKDLTQVPEVVASQLAADREIAKINGQISENDKAQAEVKAEVAEAAANLPLLQAIKTTTARVFELAGENWQLDWASLPPTATWIGEEPPEQGQLPDLKKLEAEHAAYIKAQAVYEAGQAELAQLKYESSIDTEQATDTLARCEQIHAEVQDLEKKLSTAKHALAMSKQTYEASLSTWERAKQDWAGAQTALAQKKQQLAETIKHNELVKRLREARPKISALMWGTVLGAVSHYFSQIRGVPSVVTRSEAGFLVDGKGVAGLSGSTLDALGLAIRIALAKMFLPTVPFLFLDESFSGADESRELAGLTTVAGCGFDQVILVTHRDAADALASNLVQL